MIRVSAVRFFHVVSPVPGYLRVALAAAVALGGWMLWLNPGEVDSALGTVLLLQMCAASNGYGAAARHGWFDPLLIAGRSRGAVAGANLIAAAWPGAAAWLLLALAETVLGPGAWPRALTLQRLAALALVTGVSWAAGLNLPRTGAAVLWIGGLLALASTRMLLPPLAALQTAPRTVIEVVSDAIAFAACPFLLLGDNAAVRDPAVILVLLTVSAGSTMAGIAWIVSRDVPLENAA